MTADLPIDGCIGIDCRRQYQVVLWKKAAKIAGEVDRDMKIREGIFFY